MNGRPSFLKKITGIDADDGNADWSNISYNNIINASTGIWIGYGDNSIRVEYNIINYSRNHGILIDFSGALNGVFNNNIIANSGTTNSSEGLR
jgi:hypothetical protein